MQGRMKAALDPPALVVGEVEVQPVQLHGGEGVDSRIEDATHNVFKKIEAETGDVAGGFAAADAVYEGTFSLPKIQHAHMETHGTIAWRTPDGRVHVRTSTQTPHLTKIKLDVGNIEIDDSIDN